MVEVAAEAETVPHVADETTLTVAAPVKVRQVRTEVLDMPPNLLHKVVTTIGVLETKVGSV